MRIINQISDMETREDFPFLLNRLGLANVGMELGVHSGEYSKVLLKYWLGKKLYLVDSWRHFESYKDIDNEDHNTQLQHIAKTFMNIYDFKDKATIIRETSKGASELFKENYLDFVYIDANHSYKACKEDIELWYPKIKNGGFLCGHDYTNNSINVNKVTDIGVKDAVDEFVLNNNLKLEVIYEKFDIVLGESQVPIYSWFIKKEEIL